MESYSESQLLAELDDLCFEDDHVYKDFKKKSAPYVSKAVTNSLKVLNFGFFNTLEDAASHGYKRLSLRDPRLSVKSTIKRVISAFDNQDTLEINESVMDLLTPFGSVGEFILRKSKIKSETMHITYLILGNICFYLEHRPQEFLTKECKAFIKQRYALALENKLYHLKEECRQNEELSLMTLNDPMLLSHPYYNSKKYLIEFNKYKADMHVASKIKEMSDMVICDVKTADRKKKVDERNRQAVQERQAETHALFLKTMSAEAASRNLHGRSKRSAARSKISRTIRKNIKDYVTRMKQAKFDLLSNVITNKKANMMSIKNKRYTKIIGSPALEYLISQDTLNNEIESIKIDQKMEMDRLSLNTNERRICRLEKALEESTSKEARLFETKSFSTQTCLLSSEAGCQTDKVEIAQPVPTKTDDLNIADEFAGNIDEHIRLDYDVLPETWYGFHVDRNLISLLKNSEFGSHVLFLPLNDYTRCVIRNAVAYLSRCFQSKNFVYFANKIDQNYRCPFTENQRSMVKAFFKKGDSALKWFDTFCRIGDRSDILTQSINFSISCKNNFHKAIVAFLRKNDNFFLC